MKKLPKTINIRLSDGGEDADLQKMLSEAPNKSMRVKELLRKGLLLEKQGNAPEDSQRVRELEEKVKDLRYRSYKRSVIRTNDGRQSPVQF